MIIINCGKDADKLASLEERALEVINKPPRSANAKSWGHIVNSVTGDKGFICRKEIGDILTLDELKEIQLAEGDWIIDGTDAN